MKNIILLILVMIISESIFGQQNHPASTRLTKQDYLQKSKRQRTTARILSGSGFLGFGVGFLTLGGKQSNSVDNAIMILTGMGAMITSIPFYISSGKNKKRVRNGTVFLKMETAPYMQENSLNQQVIPCAGIKLRLK